MVYTASSLALALLEMLVHVQRDQIPVEYCWTRAEIPDHLRIDSIGEMPDNPAESGTAWLNSAGCGCVLAVPSVIVPEKNYLLNPQHGDFASIQWSKPEALLVDARLTGSDSGPSRPVASTQPVLAENN